MVIAHGFCTQHTTRESPKDGSISHSYAFAAGTNMFNIWSRDELPLQPMTECVVVLDNLGSDNFGQARARFLRFAEKDDLQALGAAFGRTTGKPNGA